MLLTKYPLLFIASALLLLGYLLDLGMPIGVVIICMIVAVVWLYLITQIFGLFGKKILKDKLGTVKECGLLLIVIMVVYAIYDFGPPVSTSVFMNWMILIAAAGLIVEIILGKRHFKWMLTLSFIWVTFLFSMAANQVFSVSLDDMFAASIFALVMIPFISMLVDAESRKSRCTRIFCIIYLFMLSLLTISNDEGRRTQTSLGLPQKESLQPNQEVEQPKKEVKPLMETFSPKLTPRYPNTTPNSGPLSNPNRPPKNNLIVNPVLPSDKVQPTKQTLSYPLPQPVTYPIDWEQVEQVDPSLIETVQESPNWLINPMPKISEPNFTPGYKPDTDDSKNKLAFILGTERDGTEYLYAEGPIEKGAYQEFIQAVSKYQSLGKNPSKFVIHTPGGMLSEGLKIGTYIRKHGWTTQVDSFVSAASTGGFIFVSGTTQIIKGEGSIGFHRPFIPSLPDTPELIDEVRIKYRPYWKSMNGTSELYEKMMSMSRNEMFYVNKLNADKYLSNFVVFVNE
ncbi:hypothetical protein [Vibrio europaeus]|uniref:hypothetical protein n=1 Tax=Vibrio europaeus TaxID=300876 RepID=UPI00148B7E0B|nr:hypothetical protein [Vibrio europaeus]NOH24307.1 hypothetical protein [Vibrio europaeus]